MLLVSLFVLALLATGSLVLMQALRSAPEGMEDETGFHELPEPAETAHAGPEKTCFPGVVVTR